MAMQSPSMRIGGAIENILGWTLLLAAANVLYIALLIPETPMGSIGRGIVDRLHMSWGLVAFGIVTARLIYWWKSPPELSAEAPFASGVCRDLSLAFYCAVALEGLLGPVRAWGEGYEVPFFNLGTLPALVPELYEIRVVAGYFHSGISFFVLAILPAGMAVSIILGYRSRIPFYRLFPC